MVMRIVEPIWHCSPDTLVCRNFHPQLHYRAGFHVHYRVDGHILVVCDRCTPKTHFFGVVHSRPSPIVHCYTLTPQQYDWLRDTPEDRIEPSLEEGRETEDLLYRLGYNPIYQRKGA